MRQSYHHHYLLLLSAALGAIVIGGAAARRNYYIDTTHSSKSAGAGGVIGKSQNCTVENASWPVPANINPNCYRCFCKDGIVRCEGTPKCDQLAYCPVVVYNRSKNACCPRQCCNYVGQEFANDEQWLSSQDTCRMLTCKGGVVTMGRMECVTLCPNPETVVGYCCPLCPRSVVSNASIISSSAGSSSNGDQQREMTMKDPCVQCSCTERWCHCFKTACPALDCSNDNQYTPSGRCCPECRKSRNELPSSTISSILNNNRCTFQGVVYKNEQNFRPDECTLCKCQDGTVICRRFVCPVVDCPKQRVQYEPGLCCPRCRDTDPLPCDLENVQYKHGDQWSPDLCTRCKCSNGAVRCDSIKCTDLQCPRGYRATAVVGKCCPECEETDSTCTVFGDPHYQTFDGRSFNFQGTCRYVLTKVCGGENAGAADKDSLTPFTVIVHNEPRGDEHYAWTRQVSVRLAKDVRIALLPGKKVRLNRKTLKLPHIEIGAGIFSVTQDRQQNVLLRVGKDLKLVWDGNSYVEVTVSRRYKGRVCGLCGNYNNDSSDDFEPASASDDGTTMAGAGGSVYAFGQSWRVGSWRKTCGAHRDRVYHQKLERDKKAQQRTRRLLQQRRRKADDEEQDAAVSRNEGDNNYYQTGAAAAFWHILGDGQEEEQDQNHLGDQQQVEQQEDGRFEDLLKLLGKKRTAVDDYNNDDDNMDNTNRIVPIHQRAAEAAAAEERRERRRHRLRKMCSGGSAKWRTRRESIEQCRLLKSTLFAACHRAVPVRRYFRSCIMDTCACPPAGRCYCEALLAYARRCEKENVFIDWRSHSACVLNGDSKCAVEGAVFSPCAPSCVRICGNGNGNGTGAWTWSCSSARPPTSSSSSSSSTSVNSCSPGCYCPDGSAQLLNQCVPVPLCPAASADQQHEEETTTNPTLSSAQVA